MAGKTKAGEKFYAARAFMFENRDVSEGVVNWRKMQWRTLYAALAVRGVRWDKEKRCWYKVLQGSTATPQTVKVSPPARHFDSETVLVRIIADQDVIGNAVQNMLELAGATDLLLIRNSGVLNARTGKNKIVYLKFLLSKDSRK